MLSAMQEWDPWEHAVETGADVFEMRGAPIPGVYFPSRDAIVIDPSQSAAVQRSALAEELTHRDLDHWPVDNEIENARLEVRARKYAAIRLMSIEALAQAMVAADSWFEVAEQLLVDPDLLMVRVRGLSGEERERVLRLVGRKETGV